MELKYCQPDRDLSTFKKLTNLISNREGGSQSQLKSTSLPFSFHYAGNGLVIQSKGSPNGCGFAARAKHSLIYFFCSGPVASGCGDINSGALLSVSSCIHCLLRSQLMSLVTPTQSP